MGAAEWDLEQLKRHLQAAVELELLVIPPYLCALYSLPDGTSEEASLVIRSVVVEEMLHLILAANVLNAVKGEPRLISKEWQPRYPARIPYHKGEFEVGLRPYGEAALETFLAIENPSYPAAAPPQPPADAALPRLTTLGADGNGGTYKTIGAFYAAIEAGLRDLCGNGEDRIFTGDRARQIGPEYYYASGGEAVVVHNLETALAALTEIVEQGEGEVTFPPSGEKFDADRDLAHFYRFNELHRGRRYRVGDSPEDPTGAPIGVDLKLVYPMKPNLRASDIPSARTRALAEQFNVLWTELLLEVEAALNGAPEGLRDAVGTMFRLKYAAQDLLRIPLDDGSGLNAGPTFEVAAAARGPG